MARACQIPVHQTAAQTQKNRLDAPRPTVQGAYAKTKTNYEPSVSLTQRGGEMLTGDQSFDKAYSQLIVQVEGRTSKMDAY